jgi:hypothetical protein
VAKYDIHNSSLSKTEELLVINVHLTSSKALNYELKRTPTFPVLDMTKERYDMYMVKKHGLPLMYWNFMLKGRA